MRLQDKSYEYIKGEVADLLFRYGIKQIPVSGIELAGKMGIKLIPYSSLSDGKLTAAKAVSPDGFYFEPGESMECIYYDDTKPARRLNMTIMHEIGHAVLGHDENTDPEIAEAEAGFFAKYILAPTPLIDCLHPCNAFEVAIVFGMSSQAANYSFSNWQKRVAFGPQKPMYYETLILRQFKEVMPMGSKK